MAGTPTWTDVSTDLLAFSTRRGRQYQLDRFEPGEARITLNNKHNNYWPNNGASPYSPNVKVSVQANLRATYGGSTYDVFTGLIERWIPGYRSQGGTQGAVMELTAVEATKVLQRADLTGQSYAQENSGTRVTNVLNTAGWPTNLRSVNAGQSTIQASGTVTNQKANDHLANVALAELGNFYQSPTMQAVWQDRHARLKSPYTASQGTVGVAAAEWPYTSPHFRFDDSQIYNDISVARATGGTKTATDATSQNSYGKRSLVRTGLLSTSDAELQDQANYLNSRYKEPALTVDSVTIRPGASPATLYPQVLGREISDRVTVSLPSGSVSADYHIEGIEHNVVCLHWETHWQLSPASAQQFWTLGVAGLSELGTTTRLAYAFAVSVLGASLIAGAMRMLSAIGVA